MGRVGSANNIWNQKKDRLPSTCSINLNRISRSNAILSSRYKDWLSLTLLAGDSPVGCHSTIAEHDWTRWQNKKPSRQTQTHTMCFLFSVYWSNVMVITSLHTSICIIWHYLSSFLWDTDDRLVTCFMYAMILFTKSVSAALCLKKETFVYKWYK